MTDIPNCSNCPHNNKERLPAPAEYECYCQLNQMWVHKYCYVWLKYVGCVLNPQAREWLMWDVIEELEDNLNCVHLGRNGDTVSGYLTGIKEAITLIRNGVKK